MEFFQVTLLFLILLIPSSNIIFFVNLILGYDFIINFSDARFTFRYFWASPISYLNKSQKMPKGKNCTNETNNKNIFKEKIYKYQKTESKRKFPTSQKEIHIYGSGVLLILFSSAREVHKFIFSQFFFVKIANTILITSSFLCSIYRCCKRHLHLLYINS